PGPEPAMPDSSTPLSFAMRRASGEERTDPPGAAADAAGEAEAWRFGAGGAAAAGFSVGCSVAGWAGAAGFAAGAATDAVGALPPADATRASMFSSAAAMTPTSEPTGFDSPSPTRILRRIPSPRATSSMIALSVSTSASDSPDFTASPSFLFHLAMRP